ncbi:unnamed protein product [Ambrosiozyma monospora]|uniref:Unnamed protein product n=1 Tax=Ambrosiozyma monospora TaxID=43982 RepID=A0A9W6YXT1_AMBMO|nr:unnamed protein product [Ambrosiozyma monospora]
MKDKKQNKQEDEEEKIRFSVIDILQLLSGLLLLNAVLSYFFTSSTTWGYDGKWIDPRYVYFVTTHPFNYPTFTVDEFAKYDGTDPRLPVYVAVNGTAFDVTVNRGMYDAGSRYHFFAGHDCSRVLVNGCLHRPDQFNADLRGLDQKLIDRKLKGWLKYYEHHPRYWVVGTVVQNEGWLDGEPPAVCDDGLEFPGVH